MKKIAVVTNTSWNILNFRKSMINDLKKHFEVLLVAPKDDFSPEIEKLAPTIFLTKLSRKGTNPITDLALVNELRGIYKSHGVDLALHFTIKPNIYGSMAAHLAKIPSIAVVTGLGYTFLSNGIAAKMAKKLYKFAFRHNSLTVFQNPDDQKLFIDLGLVKQERSKVIYGSGIDVTEFKPMPKTDWKKGFHFLFVGRLLYDKGVRELLNGFKIAFMPDDDVYLHLIGDIDNQNPSAFSKDELEKSIDSHQNIIYHGRQNKPHQFIANSDCVVLPSYREGLPRVMLEAISTGRPVLATNVAGCKETVRHGENGFLFEVKNENDTALKMQQMVSLTKEERESMGKNGRKLAEYVFSSQIINEEIIQSIQQNLTE